MAVEAKYIRFDEKGEAYWIAQFEDYVTRRLNTILNSGLSNDNWTETIGTSYVNYIISNQEDDEDGLNTLCTFLDEFIERNNY